MGLAPPSPHNPWSTEPTPAIDRLLGGPLTADSVQRREGLLLAPLGATLGVEGLPQSATGQASLFTGRNGARRLGRHQTGLPGPRMRELVVEHGLLGRAVAAGASVTFANAYSRGYLDDLATGTPKPSVTTTAPSASCCARESTL